MKIPTTTPQAPSDLVDSATQAQQAKPTLPLGNPLKIDRPSDRLEPGRKSSDSQRPAHGLTEPGAIDNQALSALARLKSKPEAAVKELLHGPFGPQHASVLRATLAPLETLVAHASPLEQRALFFLLCPPGTPSADVIAMMPRVVA